MLSLLPRGSQRSPQCLSHTLQVPGQDATAAYRVDAVTSVKTLFTRDLHCDFCCWPIAMEVTGISFVVTFEKKNQQQCVFPEKWPSYSGYSTDVAVNNFHWDHFSGTQQVEWKPLTSKGESMFFCGPTVTVPFQGASSSVSLCGERSSGVLLCFRAAKTWRSGWSQVT